MISFLVLSALVILQTSLSALVLKWAVGAIQSNRAGWKTAFITASCILIFNILLMGFNALMPKSTPVLAYLTASIILLLQIAGIFVLIMMCFELRPLITLIPMLAYFAVQVGVMMADFNLIQPVVIERIVIANQSLQPTLWPGERVHVLKIARLQAGDMISYHQHETPNLVMVNRLVGMPGDTIKFDLDTIRVNNTPLKLNDKSSAILASQMTSSMTIPAKYQYGKEFKLNADEYFVIGDNLKLSYDSRYTGPIHKSQIHGVLDLCYWPISRFSFLR